MSPVDDLFISGSLDKTVLIWDLRAPSFQVGVVKEKIIVIINDIGSMDAFCLSVNLSTTLLLFFNGNMFCNVRQHQQSGLSD